MHLPPRASDDSDPASRSICHTTQDAITAARIYAAAPDREWLCLLYLSDTGRIHAHGLWRGERCPFDVTAEALVDDLERWQPARVVAVRHHPHDGPLPLRESLPWVEEVYARCAAMAISCHYVAIYADAYSFDVPAQVSAWRQAVVPYLSLSAALAALYLAQI